MTSLESWGTVALLAALILLLWWAMDGLLDGDDE